MFFRRQSLYLVLSIAVGLVSATLLSGEVYFVILFGLSAFLSLYALLGYKRRMRQFVINRINILVNLVVLSLNIYRVFSGHKSNFIAFAPLILIVLLTSANRGIKKDEDAIRASDRIR